MFDTAIDSRPMFIAFASALVALALILLPSITGSGSGADFSNPYYAFGIVTLVACIGVSGAWLLVNHVR